MKCSTEFTDTAKSDLRDIAIYIAEEWKDNDIAKRFVSELAAQCLRLEEFPLRGAIPKDRTLVSAEFATLSMNQMQRFMFLQYSMRRRIIPEF